MYRMKGLKYYFEDKRLAVDSVDESGCWALRTRALAHLKEWMDVKKASEAIANLVIELGIQDEVIELVRQAKPKNTIVGEKWRATENGIFDDTTGMPVVIGRWKPQISLLPELVRKCKDLSDGLLDGRDIRTNWQESSQAVQEIMDVLVEMGVPVEMGAEDPDDC